MEHQNIIWVVISILSKKINILEINNNDSEYHLSEKWLKENITMTFSVKTYINNTIKRLEFFNDKRFIIYNSSIYEYLYPEINDSFLSNL